MPDKKRGFKLKDIFGSIGSKSNTTSHKAPSAAGDIKKHSEWKYGTGEYAVSKDKGGKRHLRKKPGESTYKYNLRMKKEGVVEKEQGALEGEIINKSDLTIEQRLKLGENLSPSIEHVELEKNANDLTKKETPLPQGASLLPTLPGRESDPYQYAKLPNGDYAFKHADESKWTTKTHIKPEAYSKFEEEIQNRYKDTEIEDVEEPIITLDADSIPEDAGLTTSYHGKK